MEKIKFLKTKKISARATAYEYKLIKVKAKSLGVSVSQFLVDCATGKEHKYLKKEDKELVLLLSKYGSNFSRISNLIRERKEFKEEVQEVIREIKKTIELIRNDQ